MKIFDDTFSAGKKIQSQQQHFVNMLRKTNLLLHYITSVTKFLGT